MECASASLIAAGGETVSAADMGANVRLKRAEASAVIVLFIGVSCRHCKVWLRLQRRGGTFKKIPKLPISKVFTARKFEVSEADFAASVRGGHFRNATTCPCLGLLAARALSLNSNQIS